MPDRNLRAIFDELGARVVEIGPGTGQATAVLAAHGAQVVAVELGTKLANVLKCELASAAVEVVVSTFEQWAVPLSPSTWSLPSPPGTGSTPPPEPPKPPPLCVPAGH